MGFVPISNAWKLKKPCFGRLFRRRSRLSGFAGLFYDLESRGYSPYSQFTLSAYMSSINIQYLPCFRHSFTLSNPFPQFQSRGCRLYPSGDSWLISSLEPAQQFRGAISYMVGPLLVDSDFPLHLSGAAHPFRRHRGIFLACPNMSGHFCLAASTVADLSIQRLVHREMET